MLQVKDRIEKLAQDVASSRMQAEFGRLGKDKSTTESRQKGVAMLKDVLGNFESQLRRIGESADLRQHKATQSSEQEFSVKLEKGAQQLDFDVHVKQLATVHQVQIRDAATLVNGVVKMAGRANADALDTSGLDLRTSDGVKALAQRINADPKLNGDVRADLRYFTGEPVPRLLLTATTSGLDSRFTVKSRAGVDVGTVLARGDNALVSLGGPSGQDEAYPSNDIALFSGIKLSLKKVHAGSETTRVSVAPDMEGTAANMRALVQAYDALRKQVRDLMDPGTPGAALSLDGDDKREDAKPAGPFYADAGVRALLRDLERNFERAVTLGGKTFDPAVFGVKRNADGSVTFDQKRFEAAYANDKEGLAKWFGESADVMKRDTSIDLDKQPAGMRLAVRIREWTDELTGVLKHRMESDEIATLRLAEQQERLETRFRALVARYTGEFARAEQVRQQMNETRSFVDALFRGSRKSDE